MRRGEREKIRERLSAQRVASELRELINLRFEASLLREELGLLRELEVAVGIEAEVPIRARLRDFRARARSVRLEE